MTGFEDQALLRPHLLPGERIVWAGRPQRRALFAAADLLGFAILAGLLVVLLDWRLDQAGRDGIGLPDTWDILLLAGMISFFIGRFLHDFWLRRRTVYAVTNRRALILRGGGKGRLSSRDLAWLPLLDLSEHKDRGTIKMDEPLSPDNWFEAMLARIGGGVHAFEFYRIERAATVYDLICRESSGRRAELNRDLPTCIGDLRSTA